jgi:transcriptional regulator GlxA family with amidase domain
MTSLTFDTTEVFILSANSAATGGPAKDFAGEFTTLTACCTTAFLLIAAGAMHGTQACVVKPG